MEYKPEQAIDELIKDIDVLMSEVAQEVYNRIRIRTPVKSGYAQAQWQLTQDRNSFEVANDAPYINRLEHGWSEQAPHGMVAITMKEVPLIVEQIAQRNKK